MDRSWSAWAAAADDSDRHELALAMLDALPAKERDAHGTAVTRAALLLQVGRARDAVAALEGCGVNELRTDGRESWPHLVLAASRAATGDASAYRWLLASAGRLNGAPEVWQVSYLVAAAAAGMGERATADQAWHDIIARHGILTPVSIAEFSAAQIASRDPHEAIEVIKTVASAVADLHHVGTPVHQDPERVLAAARALESRGDPAGARLLLHAARRRVPDTPALDDALDLLNPTSGMRRNRILASVLLCLGIALVPVGSLGMLILLVGRSAWDRRVRIPGLNAADSGAWRAFRSVQYDPISDPTEPPLKDQSGFYAVAGILSLAAAIPLVGPTASLITAVTGVPRSEHIDTKLIASTWVSLGIGVFVLGFLGARQAHRWFQARQRDRQRAAVHRATITAANRCHCWQVRSMSGPLATEYLNRHLIPEPTDRLPATIRDNASLGRCPSAGALWLATRETPHSPNTVLLRGAVEDQEDHTESTGLYL